MGRRKRIGTSGLNPFHFFHGIPFGGKFRKLKSENLLIQLHEDRQGISYRYLPGRIKDLKQFLINPYYIQKGMEACSHCGMEVLVNRAIFKPCHSLPNDHQLVFVCHHHHRQFR